MLLLGLSLALCGAGAGRAQAQAEHLDQIKSVYVYKVVRFVLWTPRAAVAASAPSNGFTICLITRRRGLLESFERIQGLDTGSGPVVLKVLGAEQLGQRAVLEPCRFIYLGDDATLTPTAQSHLIASDAPIFTEYADIGQGVGDINFLVKDDRLRFQISRRREKTAGFKFSASLLLLAAEVT